MSVMKKKNIKSEKENTIAIAALPELFNMWMDKFIENPDEFSREWQAVTKHLEETEQGEPNSYGHKATAFLLSLRYRN